MHLTANHRAIMPTCLFGSQRMQKSQACSCPIKRKYSLWSVNGFEMSSKICYMAVKMLGLSVDGGPWHHLNEKEIWPNQGVFSEWMKFQSGNSCLRGKGKTHFCISSHGWSYRLDWWVKQAFYLRPPPHTMMFSKTFLTALLDNGGISAKGFYM